MSPHVFSNYNKYKDYNGLKRRVEKSLFCLIGVSCVFFLEAFTLPICFVVKVYIYTGIVHTSNKRNKESQK